MKIPSLSPLMRKEKLKKVVKFRRYTDEGAGVPSRTWVACKRPVLDGAGVAQHISSLSCQQGSTVYLVPEDWDLLQVALIRLRHFWEFKDIKIDRIAMMRCYPAYRAQKMLDSTKGSSDICVQTSPSEE